jgi:hypothetical protein
MPEVPRQGSVYLGEIPWGEKPKNRPRRSSHRQRERLSKLATQYKGQNWTHPHSQGQWGWTHLQVGRSVLYAFMDSLGHLPADIQILIYMYTLPPWLDRYFFSEGPVEYNSLMCAGQKGFCGKCGKKKQHSGWEV